MGEPREQDVSRVQTQDGAELWRNGKGIVSEHHRCTTFRRFPHGVARRGIPRLPLRMVRLVPPNEQEDELGAGTCCRNCCCVNKTVELRGGV